MPNIVSTISDLEFSVDRPVVYCVLRQLMDLTKLSHLTPIRFYGDEGKAAQKNSTITKSPVGENYWEADEKVSIEIEEEFDKDRMLSTAIKVAENIHIFADPALGVWLKPAYAQTTVTIKVMWRGQDKNQALRWRNDIRMHTSLGREINMHTLAYSYALPTELIDIVEEIHRLRESVAGYGQSFADYFTEHLTDKASVMTNFSGEEGVWCVSEPQGRIQGIFDINGVTEKSEKNGENDSVNTSFSYRFTYDKPLQVNMLYPLVVHNQVLSGKFRPTEHAYSAQSRAREFTLSGAAFNEFESDSISLRGRGSLGVSIPDFDEFVPASVPSGTLRVLTALATISPGAQRELFSLDDLPDTTFGPAVLAFLRESEYLYLGKTYASVFCLNLYTNRWLQPSGALVVNSALTVSAAQDLSLRKTHRARLALVANLNFLLPGALVRLKEYPLAAVAIAKAIDAALRSSGGDGDLNKNKLSERDYFAMGLNPNGSYEPWKGSWGDYLKDQGRPPSDASSAVWGLQENLVVVVQRAPAL